MVMTSGARSQTRCSPIAAIRAVVGSLSTCRRAGRPEHPCRCRHQAAPAPSPQAPSALQCRNTSCSSTVSFTSRRPARAVGDQHRVVLDRPGRQQRPLDDLACSPGLELAAAGAITRSTAPSAASASRSLSTPARSAPGAGDHPDHPPGDRPGCRRDLRQRRRRLTSARRLAVRGRQPEPGRHPGAQVGVDLGQHAELRSLIACS